MCGAVFCRCHNFAVRSEFIFGRVVFLSWVFFSPESFNNSTFASHSCSTFFHTRYFSFYHCAGRIFYREIVFSFVSCIFEMVHFCTWRLYI